MKYIPFSEARRINNSPNCEVYEYGENERLDVARIKIDGRYPQTGWSVNEASDAAIMVVEGHGKLLTPDVIRPLGEKAVAIVSAGEKYAIEGDPIEINMVCTPPWHLDQYKNMTD